MKKTNKVIAILPAYNAEKTVVSVLHNLPKGVFDDIIVSDDCSVDKTWDCIATISHITRIRTPRNLGYGGNLKYCLSTALVMGADIVVEIHPDGEYETDGIVPALIEVENGAQLVLGNRFAGRMNGMYRWKLFGTKVLSFIDNLLLGRVNFISFFSWGPVRRFPPRTPTRGPLLGGPPTPATHAFIQNESIPDLHQGFRVYTRKLLEATNFRAFSNDYLFSFQIIVAAILRGMKIASVPVSTQYKGNKRGARTVASLQYAVATFGILFRYFLYKSGFADALFDKNNDKQLPICQTCRNNYLVSKVSKKTHQKQFSVYHCDGCKNGFTYPVPSNMSPWYRQEYYKVSGVAGKLKKVVYQYFQRRRVLWVKRYVTHGIVIDVGSGDGVFGKNLGNNYTVIDIEAPFAHVVSDTLIKTDFLSWKPKKPADAVVFWESLEHVSDPKVYLAHAKTLLKPAGYVFIEYPRFNSLESRLFGSRWYHLDVPRHLSHLSEAGISNLTDSGFLIIYKGGIWAPEYAIVGFAASLLGLTAEDLGHRLRSPLFSLLFVLVLFISFLIEAVLALFGQSPIGLVIAKKK